MTDSFISFNLQLFQLAWSTKRNVCPDRLQSITPSHDIVPSCFREIDRLVNLAIINCITIAV